MSVREQIDVETHKDFEASCALPEGWMATRLSDAIEPSKHKVDPSDCPSSRYLSLEHIESETTKIVGSGSAAEVKSTKSMFRTGDVLYGKLRPYLNKVAMPDFDGVCSTDILVFPATPFLDSRYLLWFLARRETVEFANHHSTGVQLPRVGFETLGKLNFPLPPLAEQRRIGEKIDALMRATNASNNRLTNVPGILKRFRQSVLAAACSGRLTEDWRGEQEHGFELDDDREETASNFPIIPLAWKSTYFGDLLDELRNGISAKPNIEPPGQHILRINSVRPGKVLVDDIRYLPNATNLVEVYSLKNRDLLFTRYNGSIDLLGVCGMVRGVPDDQVLLYPDKLMRARVKDTSALPEYIEIFFQSPAARDRLTEKAKSSAGQQGISGTDLKSQFVALPPLQEQHEIVRRVQALFKLADAIEKRVAAAKARADKLTQSILAKAFRGELVPTEAELARQEGRDYEPASVLLERIRAQRGQITNDAQKRPRKRASSDGGPVTSSRSAPKH